MIVIVLFFNIIHFLPAQNTAVEIQTLLSTTKVTYAQATRFVLEAADVSAMVDPVQAFRYAANRKWLPKNVFANQAARLDAIALLVMHSFGIKGGIMYSITQSPHYAYRELTHQKVIQGRTDPAMAVDGDTFLFIINRVFSRIEEDLPALPQTPLPQPPPARTTEQETLAAEITVQIEENNIADASVSVTEEGVTINISNIQFLANSSRLTESEMERIGEIAQILAAVPGRGILIAGHTAQAGTAAGRVRISRERAQAVADYLVSLGAREMDEITVIGYGSGRPIADNATPEGMAANRRVEITILSD